MTPEDISFAIQAASRELGADPEAVARGDEDRPGGSDGRYALARARAYAAWALHQVFKAKVVYVARVVGVKPASQQSYVSNVIYKRKTSWWDEDAEARVIHAVRTHELLEIPPPKPVQRFRPRWPVSYYSATAHTVEEPKTGQTFFRVVGRSHALTAIEKKARDMFPAKVISINTPKSRVLGRVVTDEVLNS